MYHQIDLDSIKINRIIPGKHEEDSRYLHITQEDGTNISFQTSIINNLANININESSIWFRLNDDEFNTWLQKFENKIKTLMSKESVNFLSDCTEHFTLPLQKCLIPKIRKIDVHCWNNQIFYKINCIMNDTIKFDIYQDIVNTIIIKNNRCILNIDLSIISIDPCDELIIKYHLLCKKIVILPKIKETFDFNVTDNEDFKNEISSLADMAKNKISITDKIKLNKLVI